MKLIKEYRVAVRYNNRFSGNFDWGEWGPTGSTTHTRLEDAQRVADNWNEWYDRYQARVEYRYVSDLWEAE